VTWGGWFLALRGIDAVGCILYGALQVTMERARFRCCDADVSAASLREPFASQR